MAFPHPNTLATDSRRRPTLSVLISVMRDDPCALIKALQAEIRAKQIEGRVEIVVLDDGSEAACTLGRVAAALDASGPHGRLVRSAAVHGRAASRNRLAAEARGAWSLFLDADMLPTRDDFLSSWLEIVAREQPWIALGGLGRPVAGRAPEQALYPGDEAAPAGREPAASLLVHCDVLADEPFDEAFQGRGWEDVEWAIRARRRAPIQLVDAPAWRPAPADDAAARERCRSAARNFARLVRRHPRVARALPAFRAAQLFAHAPGLTRLRPLLEHAARRPGPLTPPALRALTSELWRASWYAEALR